MASKRALRRRACVRKIPYPDEQTARQVARRSSHRTGSTIWPYKCEFCGKWHLGHPPKRVRQAVRDRREGA